MPAMRALWSLRRCPGLRYARRPTLAAAFHPGFIYALTPVSHYQLFVTVQPDSLAQPGANLLGGGEFTGHPHKPVAPGGDRVREDRVAQMRRAPGRRLPPVQPVNFHAGRKVQWNFVAGVLDFHNDSPPGVS